MENYEYDFFMVQFQMTDVIFHASHDEKKILEVYQKVDEAIGEIIQNIDLKQTNLMIISDHGMGHVKKEFNVKKWLNDLGLYATKIGSHIDYTPLPKLLELQRKGNAKRLSHSNSGLLNRILYVLLTNLGLTRDEVDYWLSTLRLGFLKKVIPRGLKNSAPRKVTDWHNTKAYLLQRNCGMLAINLNLKGREPLGTVKPGKEYEELRNYIIRELYNLKDPETGEKIVERVFRREEIYSGPYLSEAPDILYLTKNLDYNVYVKVSANGKIISKTSNSYHHKMNGIFIAYGPDFKSGMQVDAKIIDMAPTILFIFGLAIPEDIDGRVLKEILKEDSALAKREVVYSKVDEKEKIREKIKELRVLNKI